MSGIGAVVTDIEGTTSSIAFVREVLFPYARRALPAVSAAAEALSATSRSITLPCRTPLPPPNPKAPSA